MSLSVADLLARVRQAIDDVNGAKSILQENLTRSRFGNQVNGANKSFQLANTRIINPGTSTLFVSADGGAFVAAATEDDFRGRFTLAAAPATSLFATYDFQFFTDAELTVFLENAASYVGTTDATFASVDPGLGDALVYKAGSDAARALSLRNAPYYDVGAGGKTVRKGDVGKKYRDLAKDLIESAKAEREAFYGDRKGQASSPAYGRSSPTSRIVSPYTPRR